MTHITILIINDALTFIAGLIIGIILRGFSISVDKGADFDGSWEKKLKLPALWDKISKEIDEKNK